MQSMLERVIEEQARGDASKAEGIRQALTGILGDNLAGIVPGSAEAERVKRVLIAQGAWSQYLEVGTRVAGDYALYPDDDMMWVESEQGKVAAHKDGRRY